MSICVFFLFTLYACIANFDLLGARRGNGNGIGKGLWERESEMGMWDFFWVSYSGLLEWLLLTSGLIFTIFWRKDVRVE